MDFTPIKKFVFDAMEWAFLTLWDNILLFGLIILLWSLILFGILTAGGIIFLLLFCILKLWMSDATVKTLLFIKASILFPIFCTLIAGWFRTGITALSLKLYNGEKCSFSDSVPSFTLVLKSMIAFTLYGIGFFLCSGFFLIPGIIFASTFAFYQQYIVEENCTILESFSKSSSLTRNFRGTLVLGLMVTWFLMWFGASFLVKLFTGTVGLAMQQVGALIISSLLYTHAYKTLQKTLPPQ